MIICKDKAKLDIPNAIVKLKKAFNNNYFYEGREWPYKKVKPVVFAEAYMEDEFGELRDYKFFCFDGQEKALMVGSERFSGDEVKQDYFDSDYNHLPFTKGHPNAKTPPKKPESFEEMKLLAEKLSKGIPQVRVDFYSVKGQIYFGEFTFFHDSGTVQFHPVKWDYIFGDWITLPQKKK